MSEGRPSPADLIALLAVVGLLASVAWLGHGLWSPFVPEAPLAIDLDPLGLPYDAARSSAACSPHAPGH